LCPDAAAGAAGAPPQRQTAEQGGIKPDKSPATGNPTAQNQNAAGFFRSLLKLVMEKSGAS
jgi:hypothetical protein